MTLVDLRSILLRRVGIILHSDDGASAFLLLTPNCLPLFGTAARLVIRRPAEAGAATAALRASAVT